MRNPQTRTPAKIGYAVVLVAIGIFVASTLVPLYRLGDRHGLGDFRHTSVLRVFEQHNFGSLYAVLGHLVVYTSAGVLAVLALLGLLHRQRPLWLTAALVVAALCFVSVWVGLADNFRITAVAFGVSSGYGVWGLWTSVVMVIVGTVLAVLGSKESGVASDAAPVSVIEPD